MGRGMIKKEIQALETASVEFFRNGKTETICPRCGKPIRVHVSGNPTRLLVKRRTALRMFSGESEF